MQFNLVLRSANAKTGPIPVSISSKDTCPPACPLQGHNGCYAEFGNVLLHWNNVSSGKYGMQWEPFLNAITALPYGQLWRHNQAGDLPGKNNVIDARMLAQLVQANIGKRGFTYTHYPMTIGSNRAIVRAANLHGFTINLSADSLQEADELMALGIGPVVTLLPVDAPHKLRTPAGHVVVVCPAQYKEGVTCASCKLCARHDRPSIVGFLAHGVAKRKAEKVFYLKPV